MFPSSVRTVPSTCSAHGFSPHIILSSRRFKEHWYWPNKADSGKLQTPQPTHAVLLLLLQHTRHERCYFSPTPANPPLTPPYPAQPGALSCSGGLTIGLPPTKKLNKRPTNIQCLVRSEAVVAGALLVAAPFLLRLWARAEAEHHDTLECRSVLQTYLIGGFGWVCAVLAAVAGNSGYAVRLQVRCDAVRLDSPVDSPAVGGQPGVRWGVVPLLLLLFCAVFVGDVVGVVVSHMCGISGPYIHVGGVGVVSRN